MREIEKKKRNNEDGQIKHKKNCESLRKERGRREQGKAVASFFCFRHATPSKIYLTSPAPQLCCLTLASPVPLMRTVLEIPGRSNMPHFLHRERPMLVSLLKALKGGEVTTKGDESISNVHGAKRKGKGARATITQNA